MGLPFLPVGLRTPRDIRPTLQRARTTPIVRPQKTATATIYFAIPLPRDALLMYVEIYRLQLTHKNENSVSAVYPTY